MKKNGSLYEREIISIDDDIRIEFEFVFSIKGGVSAQNVEVFQLGTDSKASLTGSLYERVNFLVEEEEALANMYEYNDFMDDFLGAKGDKYDNSTFFPDDYYTNVHTSSGYLDPKKTH